MTYSLDRIEQLRNVRYCRTQQLRVHTEEQAKAFVDKVGFCFLFGEKGVEIPTLWAAICGAQREVPQHHDDEDLGRAWHWKDSIPSRGEIFYGKLLRNKPTMVSLELLPTFYALSPNYGDESDYLAQYEAGELSNEAKSVYEALLNGGAMATSHLRQAAGLAGGANARRFDRALTELQTELKIAKAGISDANRWGYAYVYDLFLRRFPNVPALARQISSDQAMETLVLLYLGNVVTQSENAIKRLFRWDTWEWDRAMDRLESKGLIRRDLHVEGIRGRCVIRTDDLLD